MRLPKIDWDCRLQVLKPDGTQAPISTTVSAETTDEAYDICKRMMDNADYIIIASSIWPVSGHRSRVQYSRYDNDPDDYGPSWMRPTSPWSSLDEEEDLDAEDIFELKFFSKTSARPTVASLGGEDDKITA